MKHRAKMLLGRACFLLLPIFDNERMRLRLWGLYGWVLSWAGYYAYAEES